MAKRSELTYFAMIEVDHDPSNNIRALLVNGLWLAVVVYIAEEAAGPAKARAISGADFFRDLAPAGARCRGAIWGITTQNGPRPIWNVPDKPPYIDFDWLRNQTYDVDGQVYRDTHDVAESIASATSEKGLQPGVVVPVGVYGINASPGGTDPSVHTGFTRPKWSYPASIENVDILVPNLDE